MSSEPPNFGPKQPFGPAAPQASKPAHDPLAKAAAAIEPSPIEKAARAIAPHAEDKWWKQRKLQLALAFGVAALPPLYWALTSSGFRATGFGGFVGLWLAFASMLVSAARMGLDRDRPRDLTLPAVAALSGALALAIAGIAAHYVRGEGAAIALSNEVHEPGMREFLIADAHANGRRCASIAFLGLPAALGGGLLLAAVLGARRVSKEREPEGPVWVLLSLSAFTMVVGFVSAAWAFVLKVEDAKNPREARVHELAETFENGSLKKACPEFEEVLAPDYVTREVLDKELPGRVELAHRCITWHIDELPLGKACEAASDKLRESETVKLAKAEERIKQACKAR